MEENLRFQRALIGYKPWASYYDEEVLVQFVTQSSEAEEVQKGCIQLWTYRPLDAEDTMTATAPAFDEPQSPAPRNGSRSQMRPRSKLVLFTKGSSFSLATIDLDDDTGLSTRYCDCDRNDRIGDACKTVSIEKQPRGQGEISDVATLNARRYEGDWNIARVVRDEPSSRWHDLTRITLTFVSPERRARFAGTPNRCRWCDKKPSIDDVLLGCVASGHKGLLGQVQAYEKRHALDQSAVTAGLNPTQSILHASESEEQLNKQPTSHEVGPLNAEQQRQLEITVHELKSSCSLDDTFIKRLRIGSQLTESDEEFQRRSLTITEDALQRITALLISMKQSAPHAINDAPYAVSHTHHSQTLFMFSSSSSDPACGSHPPPDILITPPPTNDRKPPAHTGQALPIRPGLPWTASYPEYLPPGLWASRVSSAEDALDKLGYLMTLRKEATEGPPVRAALLLEQAIHLVPKVIEPLERLDIKWSAGRTIDYEPSVLSSSAMKDLDMESATNTSHLGVDSIGDDSGYASRENSSHAPTNTLTSVVETVGEDEDEDNVTIYSVVSVLPKFRDAYIDEFSRHLAADIRLLATSVQMTGVEFPSSIPVLLKGFARRLHGEASSRSERKVSVFLHKHRGYVY